MHFYITLFSSKFGAETLCRTCYSWNSLHLLICWYTFNWWKESKCVLCPALRSLSSLWTQVWNLIRICTKKLSFVVGTLIITCTALVTWKWLQLGRMWESFLILFETLSCKIYGRLQIERRVLCPVSFCPRINRSDLHMTVHGKAKGIDVPVKIGLSQREVTASLKSIIRSIYSFLPRTMESDPVHYLQIFFGRNVNRKVMILHSNWYLL